MQFDSCDSAQTYVALERPGTACGIGRIRNWTWRPLFIDIPHLRQYLPNQDVFNA